MGPSPRVTLLTVLFVQLAVCKIGISGRRLNTKDAPQNQGVTGQLTERPRHEKVIVFKVLSNTILLPLECLTFGHCKHFEAVSYFGVPNVIQHASKAPLTP